jgi:hypothetical protein
MKFLLPRIMPAPSWNTCNLINCSVLSMYGITRNLELSYIMTFQHMKSNSYLFHYLHQANNIQSFGRKRVEHKAYPNILFKIWCWRTYVIGCGGVVFIHLVSCVHDNKTSSSTNISITSPTTTDMEYDSGLCSNLCYGVSWVKLLIDGRKTPHIVTRNPVY